MIGKTKNTIQEEGYARNGFAFVGTIEYPNLSENEMKIVRSLIESICDQKDKTLINMFSYDMKFEEFIEKFDLIHDVYLTFFVRMKCVENFGTLLKKIKTIVEAEKNRRRYSKSGKVCVYADAYDEDDAIRPHHKNVYVREMTAAEKAEFQSLKKR